MIVGNTAIAPTMSGVGQTVKGTLKSSARLFSFFEKMVYADPQVAIWRELVANGQDAQKEAGNADKSVVVTLPTTFTPYAKVRDFGTGMTHEFLMGNPETGLASKFMEYAGDSTKQLSDDMIGGFSIGSKAPLSYTEQFALTSFINGIVRNYTVYKDADGEPSIAFLSEAPTDEPDGVEVSFPIEQADIPKFKDSAFRCLQYFKPLPILKNSADQLTGPVYTVEGDTWAFRKGVTTSQVVMGGIAYPINKDSLPRTTHDILGFGIDFFVPIGSVSIALSREALMYDDATIRVIGSLCEGIRPKIQDHINKMFENIDTKWEAMKSYHDMVYGNTASGRMIESLAQYKGVKLTRYIDPVHANKVLTSFVSSSRYNKHGRNTWSASRANPPFQAWISPICPKDIQHLLIMDTTVKPVLRARRYLEDVARSDEGVMIVKMRPQYMLDDQLVDNDLDWDTFIKDLGSPQVVRLSTIEPAVVTRGPSSTRVEKIRGYKGPRVNAEFVDTLPATGGFYVEMEQFTVKDISQQEIQALDTGDKPLLYFNKGDFEKVKGKPEWISAKAEIDNQKEKYLLTHKNASLVEAFKNMVQPSGYSNGSRLGQRLTELMRMTGFVCPKRGALARFSALYNTVKPSLTDKDNAMRRLCEVDGSKQSATVRAAIDSVKADYPELALLLNTNYASSSLVSVYNRLV